MSAYDLAGLIDILPIKRTELIGNAKNVIGVFLKSPDPSPGDPIDLGPDADESAPVDWWQHYGFLSRPPADAETLALRVGSQVFGIASRALAAAGVFGKMSEGDVAVYSIGGNVIRLNANGSISVLVPTANGKQLVARFDPKGAGEIKIVNGAGMAIEMSEASGVVINAGQKDVTIACKNFQVIGTATNLNTASVKLGITGGKPLVGPGTAPWIFA